MFSKKKKVHSQPSVHTAYVGLNGSGKTYSVVQNVVVPALERKRAIATNLLFKDRLFEMYPDALIVTFKEEDFVSDNGSVDFDYFSSDKFKDCDLFIFDECQNYFGTELTSNKLPKSFKSFLTKLRHRRVNGRSSLAVYIAPDLNQVTKFVRDLISVTYRTIKMDKMGLPNVYHVQVWDGAITGQRPSGEPSRNVKGSYKQATFDLYYSQTGAVSDDNDDDCLDMEHALEETLDSRSNFLFPLIRKVLSGLFVLGVAYYFANDFFTNSELANPSSSSSSSSSSESENVSSSISNVVSSSSKSRFVFTPDFFIVSLIISSSTDFVLEDAYSSSQFSRDQLLDMGYVYSIESDCNMTISKDGVDFFATCRPVSYVSVVAS